MTPERARRTWSTEIRAAGAGIALWRWLVANPDAEKSAWLRLKAWPFAEKPYCECFQCAYYRLSTKWGCAPCPLSNESPIGCEHLGEPYQRWTDATNEIERVDAARALVERLEQHRTLLISERRKQPSYRRKRSQRKDS